MTNAPVAIGCANITVSVGGATILDDVSIAAGAGEKVGIIGPNGSGKTTLMRVLSGLLSPDDGTATIGDDDASKLPRRDVAKRLAVVEQSGGVPWDLSVRDIIGLGRIPHHPSWRGPGPRDREIIDAAARSTNVEHLLGRRWRELSGGERQRCSIARAFTQETPALILDEPTNHLDIRHRLEVLDLVRSSPTTAVLVLHDLNLAAMFCDRIIVLHGGRVVADGGPQSVLTRDLIESVFGVTAVIGAENGRPTVCFLDPAAARAIGLDTPSIA